MASKTWDNPKAVLPTGFALLPPAPLALKGGHVGWLSGKRLS